MTNKDMYINVTITGDKEIQKLNKKYRNKDRATDVLSFNLDHEVEDKFYLGDVVVNKEQAKRQAKEGLEKEISELVAHGVLHLLGIHHEEHE